MQVKRLHEYKRQLLNVLHIIYLYQRMKADPHFDFTPRTYLFGAKAATGYAVAKRSSAHQLRGRHDRQAPCKDRLQVVFLENYRVSLAEKLMPASELSEQIFHRRQGGQRHRQYEVHDERRGDHWHPGRRQRGDAPGAGGREHFLFGLKAHEVAEMKQKGYKSYEYYVHNPELRAVIDQLNVGFGDGVAYDDIARRLLFGDGGPADEYLLLADFESYRDAHQRAGLAYGPKRWNQMALMNIARSRHLRRRPLHPGLCPGHLERAGAHPQVSSLPQRRAARGAARFFCLSCNHFPLYPAGSSLLHTGLWRRFLPNSHRKQHF